MKGASLETGTSRSLQIMISGQFYIELLKWECRVEKKMDVIGAATGGGEAKATSSSRLRLLFLFLFFGPSSSFWF